MARRIATLFWRQELRFAFRALLLAGGIASTLGYALPPVNAGEGQRAPESAPLVLAQAAAPPERGGTAGGGLFNAEQKAAIQDIVKEYFLANPEAFLEIQTALEAKMEALQAEKLKVALKTNAKDIFHREGAPLAGNPKGDITVVEFFDYNCGYCKKAYSDIAKLIDKDNKIRFVMKELPILSKGSEEASRVAIAAKIQGKYWEAHRALMQVRGEVNEQTALRAVDKIGLDLDKLKRDMASDEVRKEIAFVRDLAQKMGIQGTPHFLVGDRAIAGAPGNLMEQIATHVAELRKTGCSVC